MDDSDLKV